MVALFAPATLALGALALYGSLALFIAHRFTTVRRAVPRTPPVASSGPPFARVSFTPRGDALRLAAWWCEAPESTAAVILVHGRNACRGDELRADTFMLASHYVSHGLSVLMLDLRGHGESEDARLSYGVHERRDILGAVDFLLARGCAPMQIGVLGASMGAVSAIGAAAEEPAIGALVLDSAFCSFEEVARAQFVRLTRLPVWLLRGSMLAAHALTGVSLSTHSAEHAMEQRVGQPTLVIHAASDPFVPVAHAHRLAQAASASCWITDCDRHLGSFGAMPEAYIARTVGFFATSLLPIGVPPLTAAAIA